jgi:CubicO group peptidase (beta-lactamase class C family)
MKSPVVFAAAAIFLGLLRPCAADQDTIVVSGALGKTLDTYLTRLSKFGYYFSVLISKDNQIVLEKAFGPNVSTNTVFNVASVSKQFTATAILKLASEGKLKLSDKVSLYFPSAPPAFTNVTIDELLAHTSGISDDYSLYSASSPLLRDEYLQRVLDRKLIGAPGIKWRYSNDGYALLAKIVELASGRPFKDYMHESLFAPGGLRATGFIGENMWPPALRNLPSGGITPPLPWIDRWAGGYGASDILSTPADLARWQQALNAERLLPAAWRKQLTDKVIDVMPPTLAYARGWWRRNTARNGAPLLNIFHSGHEDDGSNAWFSYYPDRKLLLIFLSGQSVENYPLREAVFSAGPRPSVLEDLAFGDSVPLPPPVIQSGALRTFVGRYNIDEKQSIDVENARPFLCLVPHGQSAFNALLPVNLPQEAATGLSAITERTRAILTGLISGDKSAFVKAVGVRDDGTEINPPDMDSFEALGTAPVTKLTTDYDDVVTYVLARRGNDTQTQHWYWNGERLSGVYTNNSPIVPLFRRTAGTTFANLNPFRHDSAFVHFAENSLTVGNTVAKRNRQ